LAASSDGSTCRRFRFAHGRKLDLSQPPVADQRAQYARRGAIVFDLSRSRRTHDQQAGGGIDMARDVVKERGRALVGPLQIVEDDGRRLH
jgi:hypothetical protein